MDTEGLHLIELFRMGAAPPPDAGDLSALMEALDRVASSDRPAPTTAQVRYPNRGSWPLREQKERNTCVAFAVAACCEVLLADAAGGSSGSVSPHFLYHQMRTRYPLADDDKPAGYDTGATRLSQAGAVLEHQGICEEAYAKYETQVPEGAEPLVGTPPSTAAIANALNQRFVFGADDYGFFPRNATGSKPDLTPHFVAKLRENRPVAVGIPVFQNKDGNANLHESMARNNGVIRGPGDPDWVGAEGKPDPISGHAVCLVGYTEFDKGWFIFRNSWGLTWAEDPENEKWKIQHPGYGAISAHYINAHCWEFLCPKLRMAPTLIS